VIGNRFVENLALNGRSFSSLIDLAPGVILTPTNIYEQGQFSAGFDFVAPSMRRLVGVKSFV
jgi:hypothetical protein